MPEGVAAVVFIVSVADFADTSLITIEGGLKPAVASFDSPLTLRLIVPVKPPAGVAVILKVVPPPGLTVREAGLSETE